MKFSIIIPNYNNEKYIEKCINSVLNQTYKNFEIIFVDDMSSDNSYEIIRELKDNSNYWQQIKIIRNASKRYNGGSRNVGLTKATGDYILFIDSDDWLKNDEVLKRIHDHIVVNDYPDVIFTGFEMIEQTKTTSTVLEFKNMDELIHNPFAASWLKVARRELYLKYPFPEGTMFEDRIQNYSMIRGIKTFTCLGETTHCWNRLNPNSFTFNPKWKHFRFDYVGELYRLIDEVEDVNYRNVLINELKIYFDGCKEMVDEL